jgi:hypothetical protein
VDTAASPAGVGTDAGSVHGRGSLDPARKWCVRMEDPTAGKLFHEVAIEHRLRDHATDGLVYTAPTNVFADFLDATVANIGSPCGPTRFASAGVSTGRTLCLHRLSIM